MFGSNPVEMNRQYRIRLFLALVGVVLAVGSLILLLSIDNTSRTRVEILTPQSQQVLPP